MKKEIHLCKTDKIVLRVIYNMSSGLYSTTLKDITSVIKELNPKDVIDCIEKLKKESLVYVSNERYPDGTFAGNQHYINWELFNKEMI